MLKTSQNPLAHTLELGVQMSRSWSDSKHTYYDELLDIFSKRKKTHQELEILNAELCLQWPCLCSISTHKLFIERTVMLLSISWKVTSGGEINHWGVPSTNFTVLGDGARDHERQRRQRQVWRRSEELDDQTEQTAALIPWPQKSGLLQISFESPYITWLCIWSLCSALKTTLRTFPLFSR